MTLSERAKSLIVHLAAMRNRDLNAPIPPHSKEEWDAIWNEVDELAEEIDER